MFLRISSWWVGRDDRGNLNEEGTVGGVASRYALSSRGLVARGSVKGPTTKSRPSHKASWAFLSWEGQNTLLHRDLTIASLLRIISRREEHPHYCGIDRNRYPILSCSRLIYYCVRQSRILWRPYSKKEKQPPIPVSRAISPPVEPSEPQVIFKQASRATCSGNRLRKKSRPLLVEEVRTMMVALKAHDRRHLQPTETVAEFQHHCCCCYFL